MTGDTDPEGWVYAFRFGAGQWSPDCRVGSYVRRRRWIRMRKRLGGSFSTPSSSDKSTKITNDGEKQTSGTWRLEERLRVIGTCESDREKLELLDTLVKDELLNAQTVMQYSTDILRSMNSEASRFACLQILCSAGLPDAIQINNVQTNINSSLLLLFKYFSHRKEVARLLKIPLSASNKS